MVTYCNRHGRQTTDGTIQGQTDSKHTRYLLAPDSINSTNQCSANMKKGTKNAAKVRNFQALFAQLLTPTELIKVSRMIYYTY